ncbi:MAG: ABC transporter substrate-binding protein [Tissierellia bacterium]|nr:ABC transporter substrate-binding protein [Bacillota bacterium]NLL23492.1 ABC transporter substrate-binding protein [Tissierellia bacterium]
MRKNKAILSIIVVLIILLVSGCAKEEASEESSIVIGIAQDIEDSLDPHLMDSAGTREVLFNIFEGLVKPNSAGDLVPAVASEAGSNDDGTVYTFTLRDGIKFHNDKEVTVDDVVASIERCADPKDGGPLVQAFSNIESVKAEDEKTVVITLKDPDTDFLANMSVAILPADYISGATAEILGTGPYKFISRSPQENIILEAFDGYWGEKAHIKNVELKIIGDADTIVMNLESGNIDMFPRLTTAQAEQLSDKFEILEGTMNLVQAVYLNNAHKPLDDVRVRKALCYAADAQEIMDFTSDGKGQEIGSSMFPSFSKYFMPELNEVYNRDIDKARELLSEAGYPDGFKLKITIPSNYKPHVQTGEVIKEQFKAINVDVELELIEWNAWLSDVYTDRNFESTIIGVDASTLSARALLARFESTADNNFINFNSPAYDKAYANAVKSTDDAEQTKYYKECQSILTEEAANVYIQDMAELIALNKKYTGYEFYPLYAQDISKIRLAE